MELYVVDFFKLSSVFVTNGYGNRKRLFGKSLESSFYKRAIVEISSYRKFDVIVHCPDIVGGIQSEPALCWSINFYPGMGGTFSSKTAFVGTNIAAHVSGRNSGRAQKLQ